MQNLDAKINELVENSLFLNSGRKKKILSVLGRASESQKKSILKTLLLEKNTLSQSLQQYIGKTGKAGIKELHRALAKGKQKIGDLKEIGDKKADEEKGEKLLDKLENEE